MVKRRKVALIYEYNENWIGGTYYIQNLIAALNSLQDHQKPELFIISKDKDQFQTLKESVEYPYLCYRSYLRRLSKVERGINKISRSLIKRSVISSYYNDMDLLFPARHEVWFSAYKNHLYWIPDFQEHFLPEFFTSEEIKMRKDYQLSIVHKAKYIVFSSKAASENFNHIYPQNRLKQFILPFAVTLPKSVTEHTTDLVSQYQLPAKYFICCNQFWKHKNHQVILRAIENLKRRGINVFVVFTGKEHDYRNPGYFEEIQNLVATLEIKENVSFLGFIKRVDQLSLMKNSLAVLQPSLFEGWSTVIEDAKVLGKFIIASEIDVHKEQLEQFKQKKFFSCTSEESLAEYMLMIKRGALCIDCTEPYNYQNEILKFGKGFISIVDEILRERK